MADIAGAIIRISEEAITTTGAATTIRTQGTGPRMLTGRILSTKLAVVSRIIISKWTISETGSLNPIQLTQTPICSPNQTVVVVAVATKEK